MLPSYVWRTTHSSRGGLMDTNHDVVTELPELDCWELLRQEEFGRLALDDPPRIEKERLLATIRQLLRLLPNS